MTIADLVNVLEGEVVCCEDQLGKHVEHVAASDLLSDVLAFEKEDYALLTGLTNPQIIRTANITNACCVVILRNKKPEQGAVTLAKRYSIPLILSKTSMFEACTRICRFMSGEFTDDCPQGPSNSLGT